MDAFGPKTFDPKEAIVHFLRSSASYGWRHVPLLETVQFLRSRRIPAYQLHDVTFQDTEGQRWGFRFLLSRSSDESPKFGGFFRPAS